MICHCTVYMYVASASHAVALKAWGQKKRLFISFSLINEANEKKSPFFGKIKYYGGFQENEKSL